MQVIHSGQRQPQKETFAVHVQTGVPAQHHRACRCHRRHPCVMLSTVLTGLVGCRYWTVGLDGISVKGAAVTVAANSVVIDSGTSAILLGPEDATAIHSVRPQSQRKLMLCRLPA